MSAFELYYQSEHSPDDLWRAINTPPPATVASAISPKYTAVTYEELAEDGQIQSGTRIRYGLNDAGLAKIPLVVRGMVPASVNFLVRDCETDGRVRTDMLEPGQEVSGVVQRSVEADEDGAGLLVVQGELAVGSMAKMLAATKGIENIEDMALRYVIEKPTQRTIAHVPDILARV